MVENLLILAGGDGTRLREVTGTLSKPLVKIGAECVITKIIKKLTKELKIKQIFILIQSKHHKQYITYLNSPEIREYPIKLVAEHTKLGTGGAIKNFLMLHNLKEFYVSNADTLIQQNISDFVNSKSNSILCTSISHNERFGSIEINTENQIIGFSKEKSFESTMVNLGVYKLKSSVFEKIKQDKFDIESTVFPEMVEKRLLNCFLIQTDFEDIGIPEAYYREIQKVKQ